jgi:hypothetical protein
LKTVLPAVQVSDFGPLGDAMQAALSSAGEHETILVFGSFTTVSAAADWLKNRLQQVRHDADRISVVEAGQVTREKPNG